MKREIIIGASMLLGFGLAVMPEAAEARHHSAKYTITDRQVSLEKKVDSAYAANQLTLKETDNLKGKLKWVKDEEQKMKDKNGGKLSYKDKTTLERSLNGISEKLQKKMLEKRVQ